MTRPLLMSMLRTSLLVDCLVCDAPARSVCRSPHGRPHAPHLARTTDALTAEIEAVTCPSDLRSTR